MEGFLKKTNLHCNCWCLHSIPPSPQVLKILGQGIQFYGPPEKVGKTEAEKVFRGIMIDLNVFSKHHLEVVRREYGERRK